MPHLDSTAESKVGLPYWADRVLEEHANVGGALPAEPIHDLRVALRRCIVIAEVMRDIDPSCDWKAMRKSARRTFQRLGELRDTQVLADWLEQLAAKDDSSAAKLADELKKKDDADRAGARAAVRDFDRKEWRAWRRECARHYRRVLGDRPACESLVLELWENVRDLHRRAQRSRSMVAYHRLRVGLKKFRYAVENFLPSMYSAWESELKALQDVLGEVHDLTVLDQLIVKHRNLFDEAGLASWRARLVEERTIRLKEYRAKTAGKSSPLHAWREALPAGRDLRLTGLARLSEWALFASPDFPEARRRARLSLQLYDGLRNRGLIAKDAPMEERLILHAAALLQESGRLKKSKGHHKATYRMVRKMTPPPGWTQKDLQFAALLARFHRGALPYPDHPKLAAYDLEVRQSLIRLAAVLRLANAFQGRSYRAIRRLHVENGPGFLVVRADGFRERDAVSSKLSIARRFLEFVFQRPVHILAPGMRMLAPRVVPAAKRIDAA